MTDYRALLLKYAAWVEECEGVTFLPHVQDPGDAPSDFFTPDEWEELRRIHAEIDDHSP